MEREIKDTVGLLKRTYAIFWLIPLLGIIIGETDLFIVGELVDNVVGRYFFETACILLTAICVPLSLKLFSLVLTRKIDTYAFPLALNRYTLWSVVRLGILELAVVYNLLIYYLTLSNTGLLCALITLTASLFCIPGEKRLREELHIHKEETI